MIKSEAREPSEYIKRSYIFTRKVSVQRKYTRQLKVIESFRPGICGKKDDALQTVMKKIFQKK